jgi:predicted ATPase
VLREQLDAQPMAETQALYRAILEGRFACAPAPVGTTAVVQTSHKPAQGRSPLDAAARIPLVGREQELACLAETWQAALAGQCSLLLLSGEAGVGKTRLVQELADQLRWQGIHVVQGRCYEFERLLPYQPVVEALHSLPLALASAACAAVPGWVVAQVTRLAPDLLGQASELPGMASGQGGEEQERLFEAVSHFLAQLTDQQPLLLILEDLHWASDSTLQLLHYLARHLVGQPLLLVGTVRPEVVSPSQAPATLGRRLERDGLARRLQLSPLSAAAVASLIDQLSGDGAAAKPLADRLYRETEGNPFYLIQTLKALFEEGVIRVEEGLWRADYAALGRDRLPLPASVSEMIAARVGRLSEQTQDAVQVAAVVGRAFDFDLLHAAWGQGEEATLAALDDLLRQRLIVEAVLAGSAGQDYAFTHHKIQEVVYNGLSRRRCQHLHGQVGTALEQLLGAGRGPRAAELAFHFEQAQQLDRRLADQAIAYLIQAGQQAVRQSANQEAIAYVQRGLNIVHTLPESAQRLQQEVELQIALTVPTTVVHGYASPETRRVYDRARDLCLQLGETPALFTALVGLTRYYGLSGNQKIGLELGEQLLAIAQATQDVSLLLEAYRHMAGLLSSLGRLKEARAFGERGIALYDLAQHERHAYRFGHDPAASICGYQGLTLWLLGYPDQAMTQRQRLVHLAQSFSHPTSLAVAHCWLAKNACAYRDARAAQRHAEDAIRMSRAHDLSNWTAMAMALRGWALAEQGQAAEGLVQLSEGITVWLAMGWAHFVPFFLALRAEVCLQVQQLSEGMAAIAAARAIAASGGDRYWLAELHRLHGELCRAEGRDSDQAEVLFRQALETARQQEARMLELRAAMSLARLWQSQGKAAAARQLLAEVYGWFDEGFDSYDLQAAQALLQALT